MGEIPVTRTDAVSVKPPTSGGVARPSNTSILSFKVILSNDAVDPHILQAVHRPPGKILPQLPDNALRIFVVEQIREAVNKRRHKVLAKLRRLIKI